LLQRAQRKQFEQLTQFEHLKQLLQEQLEQEQKPMQKPIQKPMHSRESLGST